MEKNKFEVKRKRNWIEDFCKRLMVFSFLFFTGDKRKKVKKPFFRIICLINLIFR